MANKRHASAAGKATLVIRVKADTAKPGETAYWSPLPGLIALLSILQELVGGDAEVFADFGEITISEIDLGALAERLTGVKSDG